MDFDLFEADEDDEVLSSMCIEPTPQIESEFGVDILPEFHCSGEDGSKSQFATDSFIRTGFVTNASKENEQILKEIQLTSYEFGAEQLLSKSVTQFVFGDACINIQYLASNVKGPIESFDGLTCYQRRRKVTQLMHLLLHGTPTQQWPLLQGQIIHFRSLLNRITDQDTWKLIYFANSCKGNDCQLPAYHMLHGALEWKLLDLLLLQKMVSHSDEVSADTNADILHAQLERIFEDLLTCSLFYFAKKRSTELIHSSPFPCTCFKEFWLIVQLESPKWRYCLHNRKQQSENWDYQFWSIFNKTVDKLKAKLDYFGLNQLRYYEFTNWMISALCKLHGYRSNGTFEGPQHSRATAKESENYAMLESSTQQFLSSNPNEEQTRIYLCILMPTLLNWWQPKVNVVQLMWEHFHKRLNSSFYIAGSAPSNLAVACGNGRNYITKYRQMLANNDSERDANLSSYTLFILFLGKTLERLKRAKLQNQVQKLLGRIYAKFSLQKFLALSETGIHHLIELFIVLALAGDFADLASPLSDKLLSIAFDKVSSNKQLAVAKGHMAMLILYAESGHDMSAYVTKLLSQLQAIRYNLGVSKIFADTLLDIFQYAEEFKRGEALLLDSWLPNYLNNCTPAEQERSLEALHLIFVKLKEISVDMRGEQQMEVIKAMITHILPFLKQQYVTNCSPWMPQLAADFCISENSTDTTSFDRLFKFFINAQVVNRQALPRFLLKVLESERRTFVEPSVIMHVWLKSLVLLTAANDDVTKLTQVIIEIPEFHQMTQLDATDLLTTKEPLCVFIAAVGKTYENTDNYQSRCKIADALNDCLRNFDKWLQLDLKQDKSDMAFRFYSFIAIVIYNCAPLVYTKSNINCFFHVAITRYILPTNIQMGKPPELKLAQLVHKIWPVLVQGIGRLNFKTDPYISQTLTDLIKKWTPHFKISSNSRLVARPFISCLQADNNELSLSVFSKLTSLFLATQRRQSDPNACLVITIYQEVVDAIASSDTDLKKEVRLETLLKASSLVMLEHIMMVDDVVPSRTLLLELFKRIITSHVFRNSSALNELLCEHLRIITKRHLAFYTFFYFEMLIKFAEMSYELVEKVIPFLLDEVHVVEQKRGAGEDNRIRSSLQKLKQTIECAKPKQNRRSI